MEEEKLTTTKQEHISESSRRFQGGPDSKARIRVAKLQVRPFGTERRLHLSATEHGRADKHQVCSDHALHTTGNHLSSISLKGFTCATFAPTSGGGSCPTQLCSKQIHTHLSKSKLGLFGHLTTFNACFERFHLYKYLTTWLAQGYIGEFPPKRCTPERRCPRKRPWIRLPW